MSEKTPFLLNHNRPGSTEKSEPGTGGGKGITGVSRLWLTSSSRWSAWRLASRLPTRTLRDEAIRHLGPHQRRIVASVRTTKPVSPASPRGYRDRKNRYSGASASRVNPPLIALLTCSTCLGELVSST